MSDGTDGDCVDGFPGQRRFRVAGCSQPGEACVLEESPGISVVMALGALRKALEPAVLGWDAERRCLLAEAGTAQPLCP